MMLELLGSAIILAGSAGPPYYPSPDKPAIEQGFSNCICGLNPRGGEEIDYREPYFGRQVRVKIYTNFIYEGFYNLIDGKEYAPYGCREHYVRICDRDIGFGKDWAFCLGLSNEVGGFIGEVAHQPGCLTYNPPCPKIRIQGMPGQTIRVRCKGDECNGKTDGTQPK